jgi:hypothetical protein
VLTSAINFQPQLAGSTPRFGSRLNFGSDPSAA